MSVHVRACVFIKYVCVCVLTNRVFMVGRICCCQETLPVAASASHPPFFLCMCVYVATLRAVPQAPAYYNCYVFFL